MIPPHDPVSGCIPPGRYATDLFEIRRAFVDPFVAAHRSVRETLWHGLERYLEGWNEAQEKAGVDLLMGLWFSGSFITTEQEPNDIDLTAIYDAAAMSAMEGKPGSRELRKLAGLRHRDEQSAHYGVQVFPLPWRSIASTLHTEKLNLHDSQYLVKLGALDDFWQRKPPAVRGAPRAPAVKADRGYLEVMF
ncbi:hypothetical protein G3T36_02170 [Diaminobutyricibacter tongyongensis]|uniref:Uncharacterized protein n=1 Tax=Leifsonia tongyongensis TaxID=1268043 RepID=A0A6L9XTM9_9MICO|nr:hypothetical protein [Diaminobutyricibacter tongyongensis]NEN04666.1 hypothetical protein [Diaminobutyricibacter tongyongensis]